MALTVQGGCPLLQVWDMPTAIAFYRDILGFEVLETNDPAPGDDVDWCWLRAGTVELMLNTQYERDERPAGQDPARRAIHADTCLFRGCQDLDAARTHLLAHGIEAPPPVTRDYGMRQLGFQDPDGYGICLQWKA